MYWGTEKAKETTEATQIVTSGGICQSVVWGTKGRYWD